MTNPIRETRQKRSLFALIADIPGLLVDLIKSELDQLKNEIVRKLTNLGVGIGLLLVAGFFAFFAVGVFIVAAILGLAVVLPDWLAALIVGVVLLLIVFVFALIGVVRLKHGLPPVPVDTINSVKKDVRAIKGIGKRGSS
jgi:hypothetical protein